MTQRDPSGRRSAAWNRCKLEEIGVFPSYFRNMYSLFLNVHYNGTTPENRINIICQVLIFTNDLLMLQNYGDIMRSVAGISDHEGALFFESSLSLNTEMHDGQIDYSSLNSHRTSVESGKTTRKNYVDESISAESLLSAFNKLLQRRDEEHPLDMTTRGHMSKSDNADSKQPFKDYKDCVPTVFESIFQVDQSVGNETFALTESTLLYDKR